MTTWRTAILSEKSLRGHTVCAIEAGEVLGDVELVANLDTYAMTVICTTYCEVFRINRKQLEKIIRRNGTATLEMRTMALAKVAYENEMKNVGIDKISLKKSDVCFIVYLYGIS